MILVGDWATGNKKAVCGLTTGLVLANLESPIVPHGREVAPVPKSGPSLLSTTLPAGDVTFVFSLANNHIMDYGLPGLEGTMDLLRQKCFPACGAGENFAKARLPVVVQDGGVRLGIIACCEAQFGIARRNYAGVAELGPWVYSAVRDLRKNTDAVIVSVHAAVEDSPWPSPYIRELYHSFIDAGASVVHGHHAHIPQGYEAYGNGVIFYGMGNFAIDPDRWRDYPNGMWSLAAEIDFRSESVCWRPLTLEIRHQRGSDTIVIEESNSEEQSSHRRYLEACNGPFDNPELFDALWQEVALRVYFHHGAAQMRFSASPQSGRRLQARVGLSILKSAVLNRIEPSRPRQCDYLLWYNMVNCESHRQMLRTALGVLGGEIKDMRSDETRRIADEMMPWSRGVVLK